MLRKFNLWEYISLKVLELAGSDPRNQGETIIKINLVNR